MKAKRIISIIIISLVALLACTVIASVFIPKKFNLGLSSPSSINIWQNNTNVRMIETGSTEFDTIMEKYNKGFESTVLNAFFQGKAFNGVTTVVNSTTYIPTIISSSLVIEFNYSEKQNLDLHGQNFSVEETSKQYQRILIEIVSSNNLVQMNAYIRDTSNLNYSYVKYTTYSSQASLYTYLESLLDS